MFGNKVKKAEFGKRGREEAEPTERKATAIQRLGKIGNRWWVASGLQTKKDARAKGFKRSRSRP